MTEADLKLRHLFVGKAIGSQSWTLNHTAYRPVHVVAVDQFNQLGDQSGLCDGVGKVGVVGILENNSGIRQCHI